MKRSRLFAAIALGAIALPPTGAHADPIDTWPIYSNGIDCLNDPFNPRLPDGTHDPDADPQPGTPAWTERDRQRRECDNQRDHDRRAHPHATLNTGRYGEDWYRQPVRFDDIRWRYDYFAADVPGVTGIPGVPAAEVYRPCSSTTCPNLPAGLERFEPPYPVVVIHHGFIAQMSHHRFNAQVYAEAGYLAVVVNGVHPVTGAPNVQDSANGGEVLDWLATPASGEIGQQADLTRVAMAGHSQGAAAALSYQGDPRVDAIIAWDGGDSIADNNCTGANPCAPIMYQRTDGAFSAPQNAERTDYPATRNRGLATYETHKARGIDMYHVNFRATNHIDWNGNGVGSLAGNRLAEPIINYYALAWLDRHVKGELVVTGDGVVTSDGRTEAEERAYRQAIAQGAFDRLTAMQFPEGSIDKYNISQGFYDPVKAATSGDPLYGGNVPYTIEGLWVTDRLSQEFTSYCAISVPDYVGGSNGEAGGPTVARADSTDIRATGCAVV